MTACGLHNYCLNREAKFFQDTKFLIDQYHQPNHKGDSEVEVLWMMMSVLCPVTATPSPPPHTHKDMHPTGHFRLSNACLGLPVS